MINIPVFDQFSENLPIGILQTFECYDQVFRFNRRMTSLIKVAEEVNQLDTVFGKLAKQYSDEVEHQTGILGSLIEPLMIIFLGALVAVILVAMYLPMFQMSSTVS